MWCLIKYVLDNWGLAEVDFISVHDIKLIHMLSTKKKINATNSLYDNPV